MAPDLDPIAVRVVIHGRVQGVWYRGWAIGEARERGISGWVRNRRDGTVEALLVGRAAAVREIIEACRAGPTMARVERIDEHPAGDDDAADQPDSGFHQRATL